MLQAFIQVAILRVVHDEVVGLVLTVVGQVGVFVGTEGLRGTSIRLNQHLLLGQIARHVVLQLNQERFGLLDIDHKLGELCL